MTKIQFGSNDFTNLVDSDSIPWRIYMAIIGAVAIVIFGTAGLYTWHVEVVSELNDQANQALQNAKTAADKIKVADTFPGTDPAARALILAGQDDYASGDFTSAIQVDQRLLDSFPNHPLHESAEVGKACALEAAGKLDDAETLFLQIARRADKSPYSSYAWLQAACICQQKGDVTALKTILQEAPPLETKETPGMSGLFKHELNSIALSLTHTPSPVPAVSPSPKPSEPATPPKPSPSK